MSPITRRIRSLVHTVIDCVLYGILGNAVEATVHTDTEVRALRQQFRQSYQAKRQQLLQQVSAV